jgi:hypothetical protein
MLLARSQYNNFNISCTPHIYNFAVASYIIDQSPTLSRTDTMRIIRSPKYSSVKGEPSGPQAYKLLLIYGGVFPKEVKKLKLC